MRRLLPKTIAAADTGTIALLALLLAAAALRFFLIVNLPVWLGHTLVQEDQLYLRLAKSLASGHWLGPYDQLTLMRGPGYPAFLALSSLSGLPVSATHALFQIAAMTVAAWAVYRLTESRALAAVAFLVLAFDPAGFLPDMQRAISGQISWGQALIVFSLAAVLVYAPPRQQRKAIAASVLLGAIFAWTWLTHDGGGPLLFGLALLAAGAAYIHRSERAELAALVRNATAAAATFLAVMVLVMSANLAFYGTFTAVEAREPNFKAALTALADIDAGQSVRYVPVTAAARAQAANVSPSFRPLSGPLADGQLISKWSGVACIAYEQTCGDIFGGSLQWALRDAAAMNGAFESPQKAARTYGQIAAEIAAACADGRLKCLRRWPPGLPALTAAQWASFPAALQQAAKEIAFLDPGDVTAVPPTLGRLGPRKLEAYSAFLNHPYLSIPGKKGLKTTLYGWYRDSHSVRWPGFAVYDQSGHSLPYSLQRTPSPDLQKYFGDERLDLNRLTVTYSCPDACTLAALVFGRPDLRLPITGDKKLFVSAGTQTIFIDLVTYDWAANAEPNSAQIFAMYARSGLAALYQLSVPLLLLSGLVALIAAGDGAMAARALNPVLLVAIAAWLVVAAQLIRMGLIDASSFPAMTAQLVAPAAYLAVLATFLSVGAVVVQARQSNQDSGLPAEGTQQTTA